MSKRPDDWLLALLEGVVALVFFGLVMVLIYFLIFKLGLGL